MVEAARISYRDFPTALNAIGQSNKTYKNEMEEYARMDSAANRAQMGIGLSSNLAQLSLTYLFTKRMKGEIDEEYEELYHNCIILATLAQLLIDGIKRTFEVDAMTEVERIKNLPSMQKYKDIIVNGKIKKVRCDLPEFMKYVKEVPYTKDGKEIPYEIVTKNKNKISERINDEYVCPMNYLVDCLNKIQNISRSREIPTEEYFIYTPGKSADNRQMSKIRKIIEDYDAWTRLHIRSKKIYFDDEQSYIDDFKEKSQEVINQIKGMKISKITMNRLISVTLGIDKGVRNNAKYLNASKYIRKMLNMMYKYDKELFLANFIKA